MRNELVLSFFEIDTTNISSCVRDNAATGQIYNVVSNGQHLTVKNRIQIVTTMPPKLGVPVDLLNTF